VEFHEPPVQFAPSYKFNRNGQYDSRKRMPAWCDRCLFTGEPVVRWYGVPESSRRLAGVYSDHLPVACLLNFPLMKADDGRRLLPFIDSGKRNDRWHPMWDYLTILLMYIFIRLAILLLIYRYYLQL
jgi:hypothetical protein